MAWTKKTAIGIGVAMGIGATILAMIPNAHPTEAAIAVIDQRNIEQAAETAIKTAKILTEEQKKYALMLLQLKKIDGQFLETVAADQLKKIEAQKMSDIVYPQGMIRYDQSVEQVWLERMGDLNGILNGNITVYDEVMKEKSREKMLDEVYKNGVASAKQELLQTYKTAEEIDAVMQKSKEAEGELQGIQAGNAALGIAVGEISRGNSLIAKLLSMQASTHARKMMEEAAEQAKQEMTAKLNKEQAETVTPESTKAQLNSDYTDSPYYDPNHPI